MKRIIIIMCFVVGCLSIQAQQKWTLRQCIDYAIENNIEIKQQELKVKASEVDLNTTKSSRLPNLEASINQQFSFGQIVDYTTNTNITNNASGARLSVSSSTPVFTGFRITNQIARDKLNLQAATEGLKKAKENLELNVTSFYLEVLFKKEILKVHQEQAELTSKQVRRTEDLVEAGKVPRSQLYDIKAQLAKDELNITTAQNTLDLAVLDLSQLLNLESVENFDVSEPEMGNVLQDNLASILPPYDIYQIALNVKPHIKEAEYNVESKKKSLKIAQSGYYPSLSFGMGYGTSVQRRYGRENPTFSDQFNDNESKYFGFTLSIPIFSRFQTRNQVRSARLDISNQKLILDNVKLALYKEIQQAHQSATAAQAKFISTEKAYEAAAESYKYAEDRYEIGKSTVFEFNEAQTKLLSSKSEQIQAKYEFLFRAKILDFYRGEEIDIK